MRENNHIVVFFLFAISMTSCYRYGPMHGWVCSNNEMFEESKRELKRVHIKYRSSLKYKDDSLVYTTEFCEILCTGLHRDGILFKTYLVDRKNESKIPVFIYHGEAHKDVNILFPIDRPEFNPEFFKLYVIDVWFLDDDEMEDKISRLLDQLERTILSLSVSKTKNCYRTTQNQTHKFFFKFDDSETIELTLKIFDKFDNNILQIDEVFKSP